MSKSFTRISTGNADLERIQDSLQSALIPVQRASILDGHLLDETTLTAGQDNIVNHKLGRKIRGWIVVRNIPTNAAAAADVWEATSSLPDKHIILKTSASTKVTLWVF